MFFGASGAGAGAGAAGAPGGFGALTLLIIMVPLNLDAAAFGFSAVLQATHCVAVSVFGLPQFGQKTVTCPSSASTEVLPIQRIAIARRARARAETSGWNARWEGPSTNLDTYGVAA